MSTRKTHLALWGPRTECGKDARTVVVALSEWEYWTEYEYGDACACCARAMERQKEG